MNAFNIRSGVRSLVVASFFVALAASAQGTVYTSNADFDRGTLNSVNHEVADQLTLNQSSSTEPFIYIAQTSEGILLKMDTRTGRQVGRYETTLLSAGNCPTCSTDRGQWYPSRTAVDLEGNVWVANRAFYSQGAITKIGSTNSSCVDRNGNGVIDTSRDVNGDGIIQKAAPEFLGQADECILKSIPVGGARATLRALALDANGKVWVGGFYTRLAYQVNPNTGAVERTIDLGTSPYGFVLQGNYLYSAALGQPVARVNLVTGAVVRKAAYGNYGIAVDKNGIGWFAGSYLEKCDFGTDAAPNTAACLNMPNSYGGNGIAIDGEGQIWQGGGNRLVKYSPAGVRLGLVPSVPGSYGVGIGHDGAIWVVAFNAAFRVEPGPVGGAPGAMTQYYTGTGTMNSYNYTYSDMTGFQVRNFTVQQGDWSVVEDAGRIDTLWGTVRWNGATPTGTTITAQVRAANEISALGSAPWFAVTNGTPFGILNVKGRYLELKVTLRGQENVKPILYDVSVEPFGYPDGSPCMQDADCATGICADGVCCNARCDGQCEACNVAGSAGACVAVTGAPVGARARCATDGSACGGQCNGLLRAACTYPAEETTCRQASCANGSETLAATCNGQGACPEATRVCNPYVCGANACLTSCTRTSDCVAAHFCSAGQCVPDLTPPTVVLAELPDYTNVSALTVCGTVTDEGGIQSVALFLNGAQVGGALALDAEGKVCVPVTLTEGSNSIVLKAVDLAGNEGGDSDQVVLDTIAPVIRVDAPIANQIFGTSAADVKVNIDDQTPTDVNLQGQVVQLPTGDGDAAATVTLAAEGSNTVLITARDAAGNTSSVSVDARLDLSAPVITASTWSTGSNQGGLSDGLRFGPVTDDNLLVTVHVDDMSRSSATFSGGGTFGLGEGGGVVQTAVRLTEGQNTFSVSVTDEWGRTTVESWTVLYDKTPPTGELQSPVGNNRGTIDLGLTATDCLSGVMSVVYYIDGGTRIVAVQGSADSWLASLDTLTLADGTHTVSALLTDGVGNQSQLTGTFVVDNTKPTVQLASPTSGAYVSGAMTIAATAFDQTSGVSSLEIFVNGAPAGSCDHVTACTISYDTKYLSNGAFTISVVATDEAGNRSEPVEVQAIADNTAPSKFLVSPTNGATVQDMFTVTVNVTDENFAGVECFVDGVSLGVSTNPQFSQEIDALVMLDGTSEVKCRAWDKAGNQGVETAVVTIRNWTIVVLPNTLSLKSKGGENSVNVKVSGVNVALLLPVAQRNLTLVVPGGSPVPVTLTGAPATLSGDTLHLKFDRQGLINAINAGIAAGKIDTTKLLNVRLYSGNRDVGGDNIRVNP